MAQGVLSFKYEEEKRATGMTALAGLPVYLDLAAFMGISATIARHIHVKRQGLEGFPDGIGLDYIESCRKGIRR